VNFDSIVIEQSAIRRQTSVAACTLVHLLLFTLITQLFTREDCLISQWLASRATSYL